MEEEELLKEVAGIFEKEPNLIQLPSHGKGGLCRRHPWGPGRHRKGVLPFYGRDEHPGFFGRLRGSGRLFQRECRYLLQAKQEHPEGLVLLAGNHEGFLAKPFSPASFWESPFGSEEQELYGALFSRFPLAATSANGVLALHGGLPELAGLEEINQIERGEEQWDRIVWGDFVEREGELLGDWGGRPQFGRRYFDRMMDRYQKQVLIRSHQPFAPLFMFQKRCVTIFTSYAYGLDRHVAIVDLEKEI